MGPSGAGAHPVPALGLGAVERHVGPDDEGIEGVLARSELSRAHADPQAQGLEESCDLDVGDGLADALPT